ncbi:MAG: hypothetical protein Q4E69_02615 [Bacilli bacterium]|nr:hypothetical protein [Bacilli bacterium]
MSTYYDELQRKLDEYNKNLDSSFLELRSLYVSRSSWNEEDYNKEEERIKENINILVENINENKDLLASYTLLSNYTEDIKALTKMYNEETNIKIKDEISNELLNKREFINNRLSNLPIDLSKELREFYLETTSKLEDSKVNELESEKTKILESLNEAKNITKESKDNILNIFNEERFIIENEGPFKTEKEIDDFYSRYMNKKIEENKKLEKAKKRQEVLEKKLRVLETRIDDRREAISTANKLNINPDDYEKILTRIKKRDYVTTLFDSLGLKKLSSLRKKAIYPTKEELIKYRELIKNKLIEEKINQRKRSSKKALPANVEVKDVTRTPILVDDKRTHLEVINKLKEGLDPTNNRNIYTNLDINKKFKEELHNRDNLYNVIHVAPEITKISSPVVRKLSTNILSRDRAKDKLIIVKERLDNLSERELLILYKQYGKHNENERFSTGINTLIKDRISKFINDKEKEISKDLDDRYTEVFNTVRELDTINILIHDKNMTDERRQELENYKASLIQGKSNTVYNIRKDYEEAKLLFNNGSTIINETIKNRFLKNHELDVEVLDQEQAIKKAELQAIKDGNDEMSLRCFVEREKSLYKNISKEEDINSSKSSNKNYYSPLAKRLDYKNDYLIRDIYKTIVNIGTNLNNNKFIDNSNYYNNVKKEVLDITNNYAAGKLSSSDVVKLIDELDLNTKENIRIREEESLKEIENYSNKDKSFNLDKTTNTINYLIDNPEIVSNNNIKKEQLKVINNIPKDIRNKVTDTISTISLTNTLSNIVKDNQNKIRYSNKIDDVLKDYIDYQVENNNKKIR